MTKRCIKCEMMIENTQNFYQIQLIFYAKLGTTHTNCAEPVIRDPKKVPVVPFQSTGTLSICVDCYTNYYHFYDLIAKHFEYVKRGPYFD